MGEAAETKKPPWILKPTPPRSAALCFGREPPSRPGDHHPPPAADSRPAQVGRTAHKESRSAPRVLIFTSEERRLGSLSPFQRKDRCDRFGKVVRCERLRDGSIEVEFQNSEEAAKALSATRFVFASGRRLVSISLVVEPHRFKNSCRGVINCYDLR